MCARVLVALCVTVAFAAGERLHPTAYAGPNGSLGPDGLQFRDNLYAGTGDRNQDGAALAGGLGQLTDGMTGCGDDPTADCGSGRGYDWVGWRENPTLVFTFGTRCHFDSVQVFVASHAPLGARLWESVTVSFSEDGHRFEDFAVQPMTVEERADGTARYVRIPVRGKGRFVRIRFMREKGEGWLLVSEVGFDGSVAPHQVSGSPAAAPQRGVRTSRKHVAIEQVDLSLHLSGF
jgi:hypothetical protein